MQDIIYIGEFDFNRKTAAAVRIVNNCKAIAATNNFKIKIIGYSDIPSFKVDDLSIFNVKRGKGTLLKLYYYVFRAFHIIHLLNKINEKPDAIIYYGNTAKILTALLIYCKFKKIKLIVDVVEWFDYSHLHLGRYGPFALDAHLTMTRLIPRCDSVIAISSYLQNYYANRGLKTLRIPILVNTKKIDEHPEIISNFDPDFLNLIYAGNHGKKDLIFNVIDAVEQLSSEGLKVKFHLLGPTKPELQSKIHYPITDAIICYGRIPQENVPFYLNQADFSVLLRPVLRYAQAGFPTKFVESLNAGLPVIANLTSDLKLYLKDGYNGFVLNNYSVDELISKIKSIISQPKSSYNQLRVNAKQTAVENFDYRIYSKKFDAFLNTNQKKIFKLN